MSKKIKNPLSELSLERLKPLIAHCEKNGYIEACKIFNEGLQEQVGFGAIRRWLQPNEADRYEPMHGNGIRLEWVWQEIQRRSETKAPAKAKRK